MVQPKTLTRIVIGVVLASLVVLLLAFGSQKDATGETVRDIPLEENNVLEGVVLEMDSKGFSPSEITVSVGETVTFINIDDRNHWPASNVHPIHEEYSEFDPRGSIKPGESWSFTFERAGIWEYHDHLIPPHRGTIEVVEN